MYLDEKEYNKFIYNSKRKYFIFGIGVFTEPTEVSLDFGDTDPGLRFSTPLLSKYLPNTPVYGALYLPIENDAPQWSMDQWSMDQASRALRKFHEHNNSESRKILVIAGSQRVPFYLNFIVEWVRNQNKWGVILVQYNDTSVMFHEQLDEKKNAM